MHENRLDNMKRRKFLSGLLASAAVAALAPLAWKKATKKPEYITFAHGEAMLYYGYNGYYLWPLGVDNIENGDHIALVLRDDPNYGKFVFIAREKATDNLRILQPIDNLMILTSRRFGKGTFRPFMVRYVSFPTAK